MAVPIVVTLCVEPTNRCVLRRSRRSCLIVSITQCPFCQSYWKYFVLTYQINGQLWYRANISAIQYWWQREDTLRGRRHASTTTVTWFAVIKFKIVSSSQTCSGEQNSAQDSLTGSLSHYS